MELIQRSGCLPEDLVVPHPVGEGRIHLEVIINRIQSIVDGIGRTGGIGELARVGTEGDKEIRIPVEIAGELQVHRAAGRRQRFPGGLRKTALNPIEDIVMNREIIQRKAVGGVGVIHQHPAIKRMAAEGFGQHRILDRDVVGIGNLHRLIGGIGNRHMIDNRIARIAQTQTIITGAIQTRTDADVLQDPVFSDIRRRGNELVLERRFIGDKATHRDPSRRRVTGDGHIPVAQVNAGINQPTDFEEDGFRPRLINGPLQGTRPRGRGGGDIDHLAAPAPRGHGPKPLSAWKGRQGIGRCRYRVVAIGGGQRLIHAMELGEITPRSRSGASGELEIDIEIQPGGLQPPQVFGVDIAHARIVAGAMESALIRGIAAIEMGAPFVGQELDRTAQGGRPVGGQLVVVAHPLQRGGDVGAGVSQHLIHRGAGGIAGALRIGGRDVGRQGNGVKGAAHVGGDFVGHPINCRPAGGHPHQLMARLPGEHLRPDVHIALGFLAGDDPLAEIGIQAGSSGPVGHPAGGFEAEAEVPHLIGPFHIHLPPRLQVLAHRSGEVANEGVVRLMGHVEPGICIQSVGERQHHLQGGAVHQGLTGGALRAGALADVEGVAPMGPGLDVGGVGFLHPHEAQGAEGGQPFQKERMKGQKAGTGLPALAHKALAIEIRHPHVEIPHRIGGARVLNPHVDARIGGRHLERGEVSARCRAPAGHHHRIEAEAHHPGAIPFDLVGASGIAPTELAEHQGASELAHGHPIGGPALKRAHIAVAIQIQQGRHRRIPGGGPGLGVEGVGDPGAGSLEGIGEGPGGRPINDVFQVHAHCHGAGGARGNSHGLEAIVRS